MMTQLDTGVLGYGNNDSRLIYVPIPKNAHTTYKKFFADKYGMNTEYLLNRDIIKKSFRYNRFIVILRDPIERWVSGAAQYFFHDPARLDDDLIIDLIFKSVGFDDHVYRQIDILIMLDISRCVFFYQSPDLHKNISDFCTKHLVDIAPDYQYKELNVGINIPEKIKIVEKLNSLIKENASYKKRLEQYYQEDIRLINDLLTTGRNWHYDIDNIKTHNIPTYSISTRLKFYGTD